MTAWIRACRVKLREDRGDALQVAVLVPVLMFAVFAVFQGAFWFHAKGIALAAAEQGARAASAQNGSTGEGRASATSIIQEAGGEKTIINANINAGRSANRATVTVTGRSISLLPGVPGLPVSQTASYPVERFTGRN